MEVMVVGRKKRKSESVNYDDDDDLYELHNVFFFISKP
jgi:hypothetical protein